jgi:hypothetical protein
MAQSKGGRPSKYNDELADRMMIEIASGMSVRALCEDLEWTPDKKTFYTWMFKHPEFLYKYETAKAAQAQWAAELIEEIADNATNEDIQVAKLRADVRKWTSSRLLPKKYGDRTHLDHNSSDGSFAPITVVQNVIVRPGDADYPVQDS